MQPTRRPTRDHGAHCVERRELCVADAAHRVEGEIGHVEIDRRPRRGIGQCAQRGLRVGRGRRPMDTVGQPDADCQPGATPLGGSQRRAHRSRVQCGATAIETWVDARHHKIGGRTEPTERRRDHAHRRRAIQGERLDVGQLR